MTLGLVEGLIAGTVGILGATLAALENGGLKPTNANITELWAI
jgi:hypothetical protein